MRRGDLKSVGTRGNGLWGGKGGSGGKAAAVLAALISLLLISISAPTAGANLKSPAYVTASLVADAQANPAQIFDVIVQGSKGQSSGVVDNEARAEGANQRRVFDGALNGGAYSLTGKQLLKLASHPHILAITPDSSVKVASYENAQMWPASTDVSPLWKTSGVDAALGLTSGLAPQAPAIAIVDSGIDTSKVGDFGNRVVASVNMSSLSAGRTDDLEGHGTMVAGIAAGASARYPGVAQNAPLVNVRTSDANGESLVSDVIAASDWIIKNKQTYNIRVANLSMGGSSRTTFRFDPLDRAVEKLWFSGVTVVVSSGNFGTGTGPVNMSVAPANDPFVITVGATDQHQTADTSDDTIPSWSSYGPTDDGFWKPDVSAPGRYMIMPVPLGATIPNTVPDRVVAPGYMWMSGTSFAAPVVSGAAADILALHPSWTPDQVKGALMLTANYLPNDVASAGGVGEIDGAAAASLPFDPPNPNENLDAFVSTDLVTGGTAFDAAAWASAVQAGAAWSSAAWSSAAWSSAAWSSAAWSSAAWSSATFTANLAGQKTSSLGTYSE